MCEIIRLSVKKRKNNFKKQKDAANHGQNGKLNVKIPKIVPKSRFRHNKKQGKAPKVPKTSKNKLKRRSVNKHEHSIKGSL